MLYLVHRYLCDEKPTYTTSVFTHKGLITAILRQVDDLEDEFPDFDDQDFSEDDFKRLVDNYTYDNHIYLLTDDNIDKDVGKMKYLSKKDFKDMIIYNPKSTFKIPKATNKTLYLSHQYTNNENIIDGTMGIFTQKGIINDVIRFGIENELLLSIADYTATIKEVKELSKHYKHDISVYELNKKNVNKEIDDMKSISDQYFLSVIYNPVITLLVPRTTNKATRAGLQNIPEDVMRKLNKMLN